MVALTLSFLQVVVQNGALSRLTCTSQAMKPQRGSGSLKHGSNKTRTRLRNSRR